MRVYRIIMRSGAISDITAKRMVDDAELSESIHFYGDEAGYHLLASIKRKEVAGMVLMPQKSSAIPRVR